VFHILQGKQTYGYDGLDNPNDMRPVEADTYADAAQTNRLWDNSACTERKRSERGRPKRPANRERSERKQTICAGSALEKCELRGRRGERIASESRAKRAQTDHLRQKRV
jgi:hypothetical protein